MMRPLSDEQLLLIRCKGQLPNLMTALGSACVRRFGGLRVLLGEGQRLQVGPSGKSCLSRKSGLHRYPVMGSGCVVKSPYGLT
jgi:hypothetical protein